MKFPELKSERTYLTEINAADRASIFDLFSSPDVVKYYDLEVFETTEQADQLIALFASRFDTGLGIRWGIRDKESNSLIGTCGFNSWSNRSKSAVIGYELHPKYWRQGFAQEAVREIIHSAIEGNLSCGPIHRIQADTVPGNDASEKLLVSLSFKFEGLRRESGYWGNSFHDLNCFGLLSHDFLKL